MSFIEARHLGKSFSGNDGSPIKVFENLQFHIEQGEFISILGPSGCGKSTLLRILGDLERPTSGQIQSLSTKRSFVFQEPRLLPWRNCLENTLLPLEIQNHQVTAPDIEKALLLLKLMNLQDSASLFPHELSGGMKMRNALARSLILSPDFLLLDEPFSALDETTRLFLQEELRSLFELRKWTVVFVTHSIEEAIYLSDRIFIFSKDRNHLIELKSSLPTRRQKKLRDDVLFFEEVKKGRHLFQAEALR